MRLLSFAAALIAASWCWSIACAEPAKTRSPPGSISLEDLFAEASFSRASLSPNGQYLAMARNGAASGVSVTDLKQRKTQVVLGFGSGDKAVKGLHVDWIIWKNDDRLVVGFTLLDITWYGGRVGGEILSYRYGRFMQALDRDGKNPVRLMEGGFWDGDRAFHLDLLDRMSLDPDHILVTAPQNDHASVWKVDIHTGKGVLIENGSSSIYAWKTDRNGEIVARYRDIGNAVRVEGRNPGERDWSLVTTVRPNDLKELQDFEFLGPTDKPAELYVAIKPKTPADGEFRSLHTYDFKTKTLSPPIWPDVKHDLEDIVYDGNSFNLDGVCYYAHIYTCDFKNKKTTSYFRAISKFFEDKRNIFPLSTSADQRWWLFLVSGPDEKSSYYLFDWENKHIELLERRYTALDDSHLAISEPYAFQASDGQSVPGYLTYLPDAPKTGAPLIVMPHGGPEARDTYGFDAWAQYLATRGYLVFQPNFRGSGGFGRSWAEAGYRQWGGRMSDDLTDGVQALIREGRVDPSRICIFGASYGGYAALYAGATHPELYKCVVSWAGVSDLAASLRADRDEYGRDGPAYLYWQKSMGDPDHDAAALAKVSPVNFARDYQPPVLLIHGNRDTNVHLDQSQRMERALKAAGKTVRLLVYQGEDHSGWRPENETAALGEAGAFIRSYIAPFKAFDAAAPPKPEAEAMKKPPDAPKG